MEQPLSSGSLGVAGNAEATRPLSRPLPIEDERALAELRRGHWVAMEGLVLRYQDRLYAMVLRLVGHPEDAADLVQETFVRAMQNVARFEGKSSLYTWLFRIAVNLSISHRRSRSYRDAVSLDAAESAGELDQQASSLRQQLAQGTEGDPAANAALHLEHERLVRALSQLEPELRAVIVLRDIEDCGYEQMAAILEVPVGTVKSRLFRARAALRDAAADKSEFMH
ncbi:MAG: sigma-70 family RNA polymerase sigma factor [Phycisphaerales bacterium]|nr:sigma-70 family RNA polymerase sigma factor [Phycisphaerales bacterium]